MSSEPTTAAEVIERARVVERRLRAQRVIVLPVPEIVPPAPPVPEMATVPEPAPVTEAKMVAANMPHRLERTIQHAVAERYGMGRDDLLNRSHEARYAYPRALAIVICARMVSRSPTKIGRSFRRDHSTVGNAMRKVRRLESANWTVAAELEDIARDVAARCGMPWAEVTAKGGFT